MHIKDLSVFLENRPFLIRSHVASHSWITCFAICSVHSCFNLNMKLIHISSSWFNIYFWHFKGVLLFYRGPQSRKRSVPWAPGERDRGCRPQAPLSCPLPTASAAPAGPATRPIKAWSRHPVPILTHLTALAPLCWQLETFTSKNVLCKKYAGILLRQISSPAVSEIMFTEWLLYFCLIYIVHWQISQKSIGNLKLKLNGTCSHWQPNQPFCFKALCTCCVPELVFLFEQMPTPPRWFFKQVIKKKFIHSLSCVYWNSITVNRLKGTWSLYQLNFFLFKIFWNSKCYMDSHNIFFLAQWCNVERIFNQIQFWLLS